MRTYPTKVEVDGQIINLDTSFRTALRCLEVIDDDSISDSERAYAVIFLLTNDIPRVDLNKLMKVLQKYLQCGVENQTPSGKKDMDFEQDEQFIISSFIFDYGIDLQQTDMHWWKFIDLLNGLSSECILSRVRDIRTMDLSMYKDAKTRDKILKARAQVALKVKHKQTDEEKKLIEDFESRLANTNKLEEDDYLLEED